MQLIEQANRVYGTTVVVVTHDRTIVERMHKRVIEMKQGEIIRDNPPEDLDNNEEQMLENDYQMVQDVDADDYGYYEN